MITSHCYCCHALLGSRSRLACQYIRSISTIVAIVSLEFTDTVIGFEARGARIDAMSLLAFARGQYPSKCHLPLVRGNKHDLRTCRRLGEA